MDVWHVLVVMLLVLGAALEMAARLLNLRALAPEPPPEVADALDPERYAEVIRHTRVQMRFSNLRDLVSTIALLAFLLAGGVGWLDGAARGFGFGPVGTGLAFFALFGALSELLSLPFDAYHTFVVEGQFGFNTTTWPTFLADLIKRWVLGAALGGAVLAAVLAFFELAGAWAWVWCWAFTTAFGFVVAYVAPAWILPLFNTFTPLGRGGLRQAIEDYARGQGIAVSEIYEVDGSRRSRRANAFFAGFGRKKRIGLYDTLISLMGTDEVVAVLAHETGHLKRRHPLKLFAAGVLKMGLIFALMPLVISNAGLAQSFGAAEPGAHVGLVFFFILAMPLTYVLAVATNALSRRFEYQADAFAARSLGTPEPLVSGLKRLSADNLSNQTPHPFYVALTYSHPPVPERIRALRSQSG